MNFDNHRRRARRPAAGLIAVVLAIGAVTKFFGLEAGVLAVVLAIVALVVAPHIYLPPTSLLPPPDPRDPDEPPGFLPPAARNHQVDGPSPYTAFPATDDPDSDSDRSTR